MKKQKQKQTNTGIYKLNLNSKIQMCEIACEILEDKS